MANSWQDYVGTTESCGETIIGSDLWFLGESFVGVQQLSLDTNHSDYNPEDFEISSVGSVPVRIWFDQDLTGSSQLSSITANCGDDSESTHAVELVLESVELDGEQYIHQYALSGGSIYEFYSSPSVMSLTIETSPFTGDFECVIYAIEMSVNHELTIPITVLILEWGE